ncbi:MAG: hypothetical protein ACTSRS_13950 [Candidatus Helarchaeota archaeon]
MKIKYEEYSEVVRKKLIRLRLSVNSKRLPRRRPRDPEEELVLLIMADRRWKNELKKGRILKIGVRRYRIKC